MPQTLLILLTIAQFSAGASEGGISFERERVVPLNTRETDCTYSKYSLEVWFATWGRNEMIIPSSLSLTPTSTWQLEKAFLDQFLAASESREWAGSVGELGIAPENYSSPLLAPSLQWWASEQFFSPMQVRRLRKNFVYHRITDTRSQALRTWCYQLSVLRSRKSIGGYYRASRIGFADSGWTGCGTSFLWGRLAGRIQVDDIKPVPG